MAILGGGATTAHVETTLLSGGLVADDQLLKLGTTSDIVLVSRSTALSADAELSNVIEGTSDHLGVAANSLIISNVTNDGDIMLAVSDGGNSKGLLKLDGADGTLQTHGNMFMSDGTGLVIGHTAKVAGGYNAALQVLGTGAGTDSGMMLGLWSDTAADQPIFQFMRSHTASIASASGSTEVQSGDRLGAIRWYADDTTNFGTDVAEIRVEVTSNATENNVPGKLLFRTNGGAAYSSTRWSILGDGNLQAAAEQTISTASNDLHLKPAADIIAVGNAGGRLRLTGDSDNNDADMVGISWQETEANEAMTLYYDGNDNVLILKSQNVNPIMSFPRVAGTVINHTGVMVGANANNNWLDDATHGSGSTTMYIGNETITTSSDSRVKEDIADTSVEAVELLDKLRVVDFTWNDVNDTSDYGKNYRGRYVGMVAQETIKHAPWIINDQGGGKDCPQCSIGNECDDHLPWHVEYHHLVPTLVKAVQELNKEISILKGGN
jgi:hypothetical protein